MNRRAAPGPTGTPTPDRRPQQVHPKLRPRALPARPPGPGGAGWGGRHHHGSAPGGRAGAGPPPPPRPPPPPPPPPHPFEPHTLAPFLVALPTSSPRRPAWPSPSPPRAPTTRSSSTAAWASARPTCSRRSATVRRAAPARPVPVRREVHQRPDQRDPHDQTPSSATSTGTIDLLLIDDIQFLAGKERPRRSSSTPSTTATRTTSRSSSPSDRPPKDIPTLEERLRSRFEWGLIADIQPPDFETRVAILRRRPSWRACPPRRRRRLHRQQGQVEHPRARGLPRPHPGLLHPHRPRAHARPRPGGARQHLG